jgi:DNA primase
MTSPDLTRRGVGEIVSDLRSRIEQVAVATSMAHTDSVTAPPTARGRHGSNRRGPADQAARVAASKATLDALHQRLQDGVRSLTSSEDWMKWLTVAATFRTYSFNNQILIMLQRPDATLVKGYRAWQANGRYVRKGETAIKILAPITRKATEDDSDTSTVVGYRTTSVFALQQTAGDPLPTPPRPQQLTGHEPGGLWNHLADMVHQRGFLLTRADCSPANGITDFTTNTVTVRPDVSTAQEVKTLAHELGHILLHRPQTGAQPRCRGIVEVEAESVAYLVTAAHGLDTGDYTFPYVAHWATHTGDDIIDTITATAGRVLTAAQALFADINYTATANAEPPAEHLRSTLTSPARSNHPQPTDVSDEEARAALRLAADHWGNHAHHASDYLTSRGLSDVAAHPDQYRIGYAPDRWTDLVDALRSKGIRDEALLQTGLATRSRRGTLIDLFRGRVMFPVLDHDHAHVVGAIGRDLTGHSSAPKYINSPTTTWHHKNRLLYGYSEQRTELAQGFTPVLVEGPIDVLAVRALQQPLVPVAPSGTASPPATLKP